MTKPTKKTPRTKTASGARKSRPKATNQARSKQTSIRNMRADRKSAAVNIQHRLEDAARISNLKQAVRELERGKKGANVSKVWKLGIDTCHDIAREIILNHRSVESVVADYGLPLTGADGWKRAVDRFIINVNKLYIEICDRRERGEETGELLSAAPGDLNTQFVMLTQHFLKMLMRSMGNADWNDLAINDRHALLRAMEFSADAAKAQAEVGHREITIQAIRAKLDNLTAARKGEKKAFEAHEVMGVIAEVLGVPASVLVSPDAPASRKTGGEG